MPEFSKRSRLKLSTCDYRLEKLFMTVIQTYDCKIIEGFRPESVQKRYYMEGKTKTLHSKHMENPSQAVDVGPYIVGRDIPWPDPKSKTYIKDLALFYHFAGYVLRVSEELNIKIRWGGDWNSNGVFDDQNFDDLVHFELA